MSIAMLNTLFRLSVYFALWTLSVWPRTAYYLYFGTNFCKDAVVESPLRLTIIYLTLLLVDTYCFCIRRLFVRMFVCPSVRIFCPDYSHKPQARFR